MNTTLETLATETGLAAPSHERLRLAFGHACALRVEHLLEQAAVKACLDQLGQYLGGKLDAAAWQQARQHADRLANGHAGSTSIDGCGHAAVSASYAVAHALNGRALQAAAYAAYATVYAEGGSAAVADQEAFGPEFAWQVTALRALAAADGPIAAPFVELDWTNPPTTRNIPALPQGGAGNST